MILSRSLLGSIELFSSTELTETITNVQELTMFVTSELINTGVL